MNNDSRHDAGDENLQPAMHEALIADVLGLRASMREGRITFPEYLDAWERLLQSGGKR